MGYLSLHYHRYVINQEAKEKKLNSGQENCHLLEKVTEKSQREKRSVGKFFFSALEEKLVGVARSKSDKTVPGTGLTHLINICCSKSVPISTGIS